MNVSVWIQRLCSLDLRADLQLEGKERKGEERKGPISAKAT
jgi:hypothetical protein